MSIGNHPCSLIFQPPWKCGGDGGDAGKGGDDGVREIPATVVETDVYFG